MFRYLEDILLLILFFYIARKALGLFFGFLFRSAGGQNQGGGNNQHAGQNTGQNRASGGNGFQDAFGGRQAKPEGKISINFMPPPKAKKVDDGQGEFVDYEEVKKDKS